MHYIGIYYSFERGRPQYGYIFEMRKFTRSIYHRKVKQINSNHKRMKKTRIVLENRSRDFWSDISKMRRKAHRTPCIVEGFSNNKDFYFYFSRYYEELYNDVSFDSVEWSDLYKTLNNEICNECINHIVNVNDVENSIKKLKPGKSDGFDGLTSDYLMNASPLFYIYLVLCYIIVLLQNPVVSPLWYLYRKAQTR